VSQWDHLKSGRKSVRTTVKVVAVRSKIALDELNRRRELDLISSFSAQFSSSLKAAMGTSDTPLLTRELENILVLDPPMYTPNPIQWLWATFPRVLPPYETDWVGIASAMTGIDAIENYELLGDVIAELRERNGVV